MSDAGQPTRLKRVGIGVGFGGLILATILAIIFLVPLGSGEGLPATTPNISTPEDVPGSTNPETWVLSSTVVTSTPAADELDDPVLDDVRTDADAVVPYADRSTPLIIQVPADRSASPASTPSSGAAWADESGATSTTDGTTATATGTSATVTSAGPTTCPDPEPSPGEDEPAGGDTPSESHDYDDDGAPAHDSACDN